MSISLKALLLTGVAATMFTATTANANDASTIAEAKAFIESVEADLTDFYGAVVNPVWFMNDKRPTPVGKKALARLLEISDKKEARYAAEAVRYMHLPLSKDLKQRLNRIRYEALPAPSHEKRGARHASLTSTLRETFSHGKTCDEGEGCLTLAELNTAIAEDHSAEKLQQFWVSSRVITKDMRDQYAEQIALTNEGARDLGYKDAGALWRSDIEVENDGLLREMNRLWRDIKPLYQSLQCHVRAKLEDKHGEDAFSADGRIPAHLLGSLEAGDFGQVAGIVLPPSSTVEKEDPLTNALKAAKQTPLQIVQIADRFWTGLGYEAHNDEYYQYSKFSETKRDGETCNDSNSWWLGEGLFRANYCFTVTGADFRRVHSDFGYTFALDGGKGQPNHYRLPRNTSGGMIADAIKLTLTSSYFANIGLIATEPAQQNTPDINALMKKALSQIATLPYQLSLQIWTDRATSGRIIDNDHFNHSWWRLRERVQGVASPAGYNGRSFDAGIAATISHNRSQSGRYLRTIGSYQLLQKLCDAAGWQGPLSQCSIDGSKAAGDVLKTVTASGSSLPLYQTLAVAGGDGKQVQTDGILKYYAPLKAYLDKKNQGRQCGW